MITVDALINLYLMHVPGAEEASVDRQRLESIVNRPHATRGGLPIYPTLFGRIAAIVHGIVRERPFGAGNREAALVVAGHLLAKHGYALSAPDEETDKLFAGVELGFTTSQRVVLWLKRRTRRYVPER